MIHYGYCIVSTVLMLQYCYSSVPLVVVLRFFVLGAIPFLLVVQLSVFSFLGV